MTGTLYIKGEDFHECVNKDRLTVVKFTADWCGPCKATQPRYEQLSDANDNCMFLCADIDEEQEMAAFYDITSIPTFCLFKSGKLLSTVRGPDMRALSQAVAKHATQ